MTLDDPQALGLQPHPEGGWYRRIWTHEQTLATAAGHRPLATAVSFLLLPGERSAWHRVTSAELWLWQGGGSLRLSTGGEADGPGEPRPALLEPGGHLLVPAGVWQTAEPVEDAPVLVACVVSPGFDFADFTLLDGD